LSFAAQNATDTRSELGARFDNLQVVDGMPLVLRARTPIDDDPQTAYPRNRPTQAEASRPCHASLA
jgi:hypothetical protein